MATETTIKPGILISKLPFIIAFLLIAGITLSIWLISDKRDSLMLSDAIEDATLISNTLMEFRQYYSENVVPNAQKAGVDVTHDYHAVENGIPLPVTLTMELAKKLDDSHYGTTTRLYSNHPFPWNKAGGPRDLFEKQALEALKHNPDQIYTKLEIVDGLQSLRFASADLMIEACITCHNAYPSSPKRDWKKGDLAGALSVTVPLNPEHLKLHGVVDYDYLLAAGLLILLVFALYLANANSHVSIAILKDEVNEKMKALQEAEASLAAAQQIGQIGNWSLDLILNRLWVSDGLLRTFGISSDEFDGTLESIIRHMHRDDRQPFRDCVNDTTRTMKKSSMEYRIILPGGEMRYLYETAEVVENKAEGQKRLVGVVQDITEKRDREARLNMISMALEQAGEAVLITDSSNNIKYVNKTFVDVTGYSAKEVIGKNPKLLSSGRQGNDFYESMWEELKKNSFWKGRIWNRRKNGEVFPEQLHIREITNEHGEIVNYAAVFSDITEQLKMENQFRQSQKMEAIGTLVGGIAHDFNNILTAITGSLYLLRKDVKDRPGVLDKIGTIENESFRAAEMIDQLLTFARKDVVRIEGISLTGLFNSARDLVQVTVREDIKLVWNPCPDGLTVDGDENQLKQIILNLVNNARDALEGVENPEITVALKKYDPDSLFREKYPNVDANSYACIEVGDNGCGISKDSLEHIFEPFYTTKEVGKGTGLGLSMIYGSIQNHHGIIQVETEIEKGTTFRIYLPCVKPWRMSN